MGYTVYSLADEDRHQGSGMSLAEAFAKMMALAHCNYAFGRIDGDLHLTVTPLDDVPEEYLHDPAIRARMFPEYRSKYLDDEIARNDLMRRFLKHGLGGYHIVSDEEYAREEAKWRAAQSQEMEEDSSFRPFSDGPVHWKS
jgi:hypothetical protein